MAERSLKHYESLALPRLIRLKLNVDLFPAQQKEETNAWATLRNNSNKIIDTFLVDGDGLSFDLKQNGVSLSYSSPLYFPRGKFTLFRPAKEPSDYRLYVLPVPMQPGDTMLFEVHSIVAYR